MAKEKKHINICYLYPELLNLYGDRGNVLALVQRCRWREINVTVHQINLGDDVDFRGIDFLFLGGGSDREQTLMAEDLKKRRGNLQAALEDGLVVLAICGGYQLLGQYYRTQEDRIIPGMELLDFYTEVTGERSIGNVAVEICIGGESFKVTGFENHAGHTFLGRIAPLGRVLAGCGNNGRDGTEGARYKNVFCSYLHGPLLPKNTRLTDYLIKLALQRRGFSPDIAPLDDRLETMANDVMLNRLLRH